jgi:hypothetical protein
MKKAITLFFLGLLVQTSSFSQSAFFSFPGTSGNLVVGQSFQVLGLFNAINGMGIPAPMVMDWTGVTIEVAGGDLNSLTDACGVPTACASAWANITITAPSGYIKFIKTSAPAATSTYSFANALPIELTSFEAKPFQTKVELTWTTATETNNREFGIEQSWDGKNWKSIDTQSGAGTTIDAQFYQYSDYETCTNPQAATTYYRLRTTDFDGQESHSEMISVKLKTDVSRLEFGTIAADLLRFKSPNEENVQVSWLNFNGQLMYQKSMLAQKGFNEMTVDQDIPNGLYVIRMLSATQSAVLKVKI